MNVIEIKSLAKKVLGTDFSDVTFVESDCVLAEVKNNKRTVGGNKVYKILRALSLLVINGDKGDFRIVQKENFKKLGISLDMSRGCVMRVEKVKEFIAKLAMFGANEIMLYTEDTYTLEDYQHFGYLRGAYTDDELREIDDFAYALDVEVVPCIQTLGHMEQYLSWRTETSKIKDTDSILLCDCDGTYRFIEAEISKMKKVFRSNNIHIGMDEAHYVGLGTYLEKNGFENRFDLLKRHLSKVVDICKKYNYSPMMWSDMFFRIGSPEGYYYNTNGTFPEGVTENIPDVSMVYWDYYNSNEEKINKMFDRHEQLKKPIIFAGGIWTWVGFVPAYNKTVTTMIPAMRICRERNIDNVIATMWGDDGCETDYFRGLYQFGIFSENCYCQEEPTREQMNAIGSLISGISDEEEMAIEKFHSLNASKGLIWGDIFFNELGVDFSKSEHIAVYDDVIKSNALKNDEFSELLFEVAREKAMIYASLQNMYKNGKSLKDFSQNILPELYKKYARLYELHKEIRNTKNKVFGFEIIEARYAMAMHRIKYAEECINDYVNGKTTQIEELEYTPLYGEAHGVSYNRIAFTKI